MGIYDLIRNLLVYVIYPLWVIYIAMELFRCILWWRIARKAKEYVSSLKREEDN